MQPLMTADLQKETAAGQSGEGWPGSFKTMGELEKSLATPRFTKSGPNSIIVVPVKFTPSAI